ncbi:MAG: hypothetical protein GX221_01175 [Candidatus Riflebacteria bacterium]|nr:hypothetical protein [Candidatus Riflebacteria bacterium]
MANLPRRNKYHLSEQLHTNSLDAFYMVRDSEDGHALAAVQEYSSLPQKISRMFLDKVFLPSHFVMTTDEGDKIFSLDRPISPLKPEFTMRNPKGRTVCIFKKSSFNFAPEVDVLDETATQIATISGDLRKSKFVFKDKSGKLISVIYHESSLLKDFLCTADDYKIIMENETLDTVFHEMSVAAALCLDVMYHD